MDPNETLKMLAMTENMKAHRARKYRLELYVALRDWLWHGGFEPNWAAQPKGTEYFRNLCRRNGPARYANVGK